MKPLYRLLCLSVLLLVAGCRGENGGETSSNEISSSTATSTTQPTATEVPTATSPPALMVLLAPEGADPDLTERLQAFLSQASSEQGLRFQIRPALSPQDLEAEDMQAVIALPPLPNLGELVTSAPETRFLGLGVEGMEPTSNLSILGGGNLRYDQGGFLAGYMAALITPDWRVGVISVSDRQAGQIARQSFLNGVKYYCGLCRATYPPFADYPLYAEVGSTAEPAEWQAAANILLNNGVETIYVGPGAGGPELLAYLAQSGIKLIGGAPPPEEIRDAWVATLRFSIWETFQDFWPDFLAGAEGQFIPVPLTLTDVNQDNLSTGRQRLVEDLLEEIKLGYIQVGPESTGE